MIFLFSYLGIHLFDEQTLFLAGGHETYLKNPVFWGLGNFDGEHYLSIAQNGYRHLQYFYFPLYPAVIRLFSPTANLDVLLAWGLFVSSISFLLSLIGFYKLLLIDFKRNTVKLVILALICFPTSFYFASLYTESFFLMTVVWSMYFARIRLWPLSGMLGLLASATRIVGLALYPVLLIESHYLEQRRKLLNAIFISLTLFGFLGYVFFMWKTTGNPASFNQGSELFGEYRSQNPLLLPQILYRYLFKILPNINISYFPSVFTILLEFSTGLVLTIAVILGIFKLRFSYYVYMVAAFLMPSFYNGFVSLPRYGLVIFPLYILIALFLKYRNTWIKSLYFGASVTLLFIATSLFIRGYWIS